MSLASWVRKGLSLACGIFLFFLPLIPHGPRLTTSFLWADESAPTLKIAWVDLDRVFKGYKGTQSSEEKLEGLSKSKISERETMVSEIRGLRDELVLLNDQNRSKQQELIEEKLRKLASFDQNTREEFRGEREETLKAILIEIEKAVESFAEQKGFDLVLPDRAVLYGDKAIDVTDEIIAILNSSHAG